jgi:ankyrin repeat protein
LANPQECPDLINVQPSMRWTALHQAAFNGDAEVAAFLLEKGEDGEDESQDESSIGYFGHIYNIYDIIYILYL